VPPHPAYIKVFVWQKGKPTIIKGRNSNGKMEKLQYVS
jgi:hypothetical protein